MKIDIFEEINNELKKQKRKAPWLAEEVNKSTRNMYGILNKRKDIYVGDLAEISVALNRNFFKLYVPSVDASISASISKKNITEDEANSPKSTLTMGIKYPDSRTTDVGVFLKQIKLLAEEYGFEVE